MLIENFRDQDAKAAYSRFGEKGRQCPDGLTFLGSWVSADLCWCFQIMECNEVAPWR